MKLLAYFIMLVNFPWDSLIFPSFHLRNYIVKTRKLLLQMCLRNNLIYKASLKIIQFCLREIGSPLRFGFWPPGQKFYSTVSNFSGLRKIRCGSLGRTISWVYLSAFQENIYNDNFALNLNPDMPQNYCIYFSSVVHIVWISLFFVLNLLSS